MASMLAARASRGSTTVELKKVPVPELDLLACGALQVDELITHRYALHDVDRAIAPVQSREEPVRMAVVHP